MKRLISIFKHYKWLSLLIFFVFLFWISFSTDISQNWTSWEWWSSFSYMIMSIADLLWTIWFIFPIIAWKLLTNVFVYWSVFNLDVTLWNVWNFSRTLANFIIWFLFIYLIFKYILSFSDKDASLIKSWLPKIVISSILVNMSWFLVWVVIDISTILIAAFWTMSWNMVETPPLVLPKNVEISVQKCNPSQNPACIKSSLQTNVKNKNALTLADLQTYETTISWPLIFLWTSILEITASKDKLFNQAYDFQAKKFKHWWAAIKAITKIFIFLMFIIPIIILIVVNIVRIFWLWIYIAFSPLLLLDWIWGKNKLWSVNKAFAFKNAIWLIFSPALVVLWFSVSIILILWVADALNTVEWTNTYEERVKRTFLLWDSWNWIFVTDFWQAQDSEESASKYIWWFFGYLITTILLVILVWSILKLSFKASEVTSWIADKMFSFSEEVFKTIPVPTPMWKVSIWSLKALWWKIQSIPWERMSKQANELTKMFSLQQDLNWSQASDIVSNLSSSNKKVFEDWVNNALSEIEKFKWKREVEKSPNIQKIIDELIKQINSKASSVWLTSVSSQLWKAKTYKEKVDLITKYQSDIKTRLK